MLSSAPSSLTLPGRLIDYGLALFQQVAGIPPADSATVAGWAAYAAAMGGTTPSAPASRPLLSLLSVLQAPTSPPSAAAPTPAYFRPGLLALADDTAIHPSSTPWDTAALTAASGIAWAITIPPSCRNFSNDSLVIRSLVFAHCRSL